MASLQVPQAFEQFLAPAASAEWVVYAKAPFGGPEQVLQYLGRYTHRVAISNSRYGHQPSLVTGGFQAPCSSRLLTTALTCAAT